MNLTKSKRKEETCSKAAWNEKKKKEEELRCEEWKIPNGGLHHHKTRNVVSHWTCIAFHEGVGPLLA